MIESLRWRIANLLWMSFAAIVPTRTPERHIAVGGVEYFRHHRDEFPEYEGEVWRTDGQCLTHGAR